MDQARFSGIGPARVALTFDDGPHPKNTEALVNLLSERAIPATFFLLGEHMSRRPEIVRFIHNAGHEIANHGWSHSSFAALDEKQILHELGRTNEAIRTQSSQECTIYRPPYGAITRIQRELIERKLGLRLVLWNVDSLDWQKPTVDKLIARTTNFAFMRAVLLFHDFADVTREALPRVLDILSARNCNFCTASRVS
jgi:peptidoglycan/xylan/chitin deacetylase (PgdA/CDA1 family)